METGTLALSLTAVFTRSRIMHGSSCFSVNTAWANEWIRGEAAGQWEWRRLGVDSLVNAQEDSPRSRSQTGESMSKWEGVSLLPKGKGMLNGSSCFMLLSENRSLPPLQLKNIPSLLFNETWRPVCVSFSQQYDLLKNWNHGLTTEFLSIFMCFTTSGLLGSHFLGSSLG